MARKFFQDLEAKLPRNTKHKVVVPLAANKAVALALKEALDKNLINGAILVGSSNAIKSEFGSLYKSDKISLIEAVSEKEALI